MGAVNDGPQKREESRYDQLAREVDELVLKWRMEGAEPNMNFQPNMYIISTKIDLMMDAIKELLDITDEDMAIRYMEKLIENLKSGYEQIVKLNKEARKPKIDIFRGLPPNLDGKLN